MHRLGLPAHVTVAVMGAYALTSLITFVVFGFDKHRAAKKGRRVPERTLFGLTFAFGFPGAIAGMLVFRHKTRKRPFIVKTALIIVAHLVLVAMVVRAFSS
ncbi:MAG: DUF1294 domain-containing protein [Kofleriaceae bacterium]|nr:DUF1294 domain-containing protein [Kofleriaceae bacterium]